MIYIYSLSCSNSSFAKSKKYFDDKKIKYKTQPLNQISLQNLLNIVKISPDLESLINKNQIKKLDWNIKFQDIVKQIKEKPNILKSPIIVDYEHQVIITGYQKENLDLFLRFKK